MYIRWDNRHFGLPVSHLRHLAATKHTFTKKKNSQLRLKMIHRSAPNICKVILNHFPDSVIPLLPLGGNVLFLK